MAESTNIIVEPDVEVQSDNSLPEKDTSPSLFYQCLAEAFGTCFIVIVGVNAVHGAVLAGGAAGNFQVGMMFALGIMWGVYTAGSVRIYIFKPYISSFLSSSTNLNTKKYIDFRWSSQPRHNHRLCSVALARFPNL